MGTVSENHPCSRETRKQKTKDVPSKPVKSESKPGMARCLPRPERLQQPVLTSSSTPTKPAILTLDILPQLPGSSTNAPGTAATARICPGTALCSSCPASTGSTCAACPLPILPIGAQESTEPMQIGLTITTRVTNNNSKNP